MFNTKVGLFFRVVAIVGVSIYLTLVYVVLRFRRQIRPPFSLTHLLRTWIRSPYKGTLQNFRREEGFCWLSSVPNFILSDRESYSKLVVLEDGRPLVDPHASHEKVRKSGRGAYSHWGSEVYLSSSDNTDPSTNGRKYEVIEVK
jgi:hypothetical protein